jgi:hypothetical protein
LIFRRSAQKPQRPQRRFLLAIAACCACTIAIGCGKKGPPLPPLVRLPAAPSEFTAERRGGAVDLQFTVPAANTDNTRPANVERVEVYAVTAREPWTDAQIVAQGKRVAAVDVKAPKDPERTIEEDESAADMEAPQGSGLDQGAVAHVSEELTAESLTPKAPKAERKKREPEAMVGRPLTGAPPTPLTRSYLAVGVSTNEKKGPPSKRLSVPLLPPPPAPGAPEISYDEKTISVTWEPVAPRGGVQTSTAEGELPSRPIGVEPVTIAYNVYDVTAEGRPVKLTTTAVPDLAFSDTRITWGQERCYTVRAVATVDDLSLESDAADRVCRTLVDTFPPAAPVNLQSSPTDGAISLIWDANGEADLAGYLVFRGQSSEALRPMTDTPIQETTFRDAVAAGIRFTYAVKAVDRAGNQSPLSKSVEEAAR